MARKSRKMSVQNVGADIIKAPVAEALIEKIPTAIYGRLSVEDGDSAERMENQIDLVRNYIEQNQELEYIDTYFDNGFSGTNFKRPDFNRLMSDVRQKKIACIVVKDLSRFGRNYLEAGYYIETVFPFLGVRLIAVTDNFDSSRKEDMGSLAVPIKNMVNAMYAKDISKKIWTSVQKSKQAGQVGCAHAPYGYIKNPNTGRYEIDMEAAVYVELIFQWKLLGVPDKEISKRLDVMGVATPLKRYSQLSEGRLQHGGEKWFESTVKNILRNQAYAGDTVTNKSSQMLFAGKPYERLPKEEWIITPNTHPAIIARDDFEKVQEMMGKSRKARYAAVDKNKSITEKYQNDLENMVFCADCGSPMRFSRETDGTGKGRVCYYRCATTNKDVPCIPHHITESLLKALVMDQVHLFLTKLSDKRKVLEELQNLQTAENPIYRAKGEIISLTDKAGRVAEKRQRLYADYAAGVVDTEDYQLIKADYARQQEQLQEELRQAEKRKKETEKRMSDYLEMTARLEAHLDDRKFDVELVKSLVQKIEVGADKHIRITFRFRDIFEDDEMNGKAGELNDCSISENITL